MNAIRAVKLILLAILLVVISVSINFIKCTDNRLFTLLKNWTQSALPSLESNSVLLNIAGRSNQSSSDKNGDFNTIFDFNITTSIFEQCRTCALVSSSGYLRNSSAGARINVADCIFRMNMAPVRGYENDVGNRTTFRFVAHSSLHFIFHSLYRKRKEQGSITDNFTHTGILAILIALLIPHCIKFPTLRRVTLPLFLLCPAHSLLPRVQFLPYVL